MVVVSTLYHIFTLNAQVNSVQVLPIQSLYINTFLLLE
jgi:hypothetical protein